MPGGNIVLGVLNVTAFEVLGYVVKKKLESLGYDVHVVEGNHEDIFHLVANGEVDLLVGAWLPQAHQLYWEEYKDKLISVSVLYEDVKLFWAAPTFMPITKIDDLLLPEVAAKTNKLIRTIGPGASITRLSYEVFESYGLAGAGYSISIGSEAEWIAWIDEKMNQGEWFVFPMWQPQYANKAYSFRQLEDTKGIFVHSNNCELIANQNFPSKVQPNVLEELKQIKTTVDAVTEMDYLVQVKGKTPESAVDSVYFKKKRSFFGRLS